jgi:hypothetical protein
LTVCDGTHERKNACITLDLDSPDFPSLDALEMIILSVANQLLAKFRVGRFVEMLQTVGKASTDLLSIYSVTNACTYRID